MELEKKSTLQPKALHVCMGRKGHKLSGTHSIFLHSYRRFSNFGLLSFWSRMRMLSWQMPIRGSAAWSVAVTVTAYSRWRSRSNFLAVTITPGNVRVTMQIRQSTKLSQINLLTESCHQTSSMSWVYVPVSGWILNAGTVESLCMKPYVTLPLEPSSASTAWTCRTNDPAGWFSRTDVLSLYCWHWGERKQQRQRCVCMLYVSKG